MTMKPNDEGIAYEVASMFIIKVIRKIRLSLR